MMRPVLKGWAWPVRAVLVSMMTAVLALAWSVPADARGITLTDNNATATIDELNGGGITSLSIAGVNNLYQEWFWYRTGDMTRERTLDGATFVSGVQTSDRSWTGLYRDPGKWEIEVLLSLTGTPGTAMADMAESIRITNLTQSTLAFSFFEYTDWDLDDESEDASVTLVGGPPVDGAMVVEQLGLHGSSSKTTINSPTSISRYELATYSATLDKLNDDAITNLASTYPAAGNVASLMGPADLTWAVQWDLSLAAGTSYLISKDKLLTLRPVPEPATLGMLLLLAPPALAVRAWRRRRARA